MGKLTREVFKSLGCLDFIDEINEEVYEKYYEYLMETEGYLVKVEKDGQVKINPHVVFCTDPKLIENFK